MIRTLRSAWVIARGDGCSRMGFGCWPTLSAKLCTISGQALKYPCTRTGGSRFITDAASVNRSSTIAVVHSPMARLPVRLAVQLLAELADQLALYAPASEAAVPASEGVLA